METVDKAPNPGSSQSGSGMGTYKAGEFAKFWTEHYGSIGTNSDKAAEFQFALWKIEYDWTSSSQSTSFTTGNFRATETSNNALTDATAMLKDVIEYDSAHQASPDLWALTSTGAQDQSCKAWPAYLAGIGALCLLRYGYLCRKPRLLPRAAAPA